MPSSDLERFFWGHVEHGDGRVNCTFSGKNKEDRVGGDLRCNDGDLG